MREDFKALDRVAGGSPEIRRGVGQLRRPAPAPACRRVGIERVEALEPEIPREGALQRCRAAFVRPTRHAGEGHQEIGQLLTRRAASQDVQAVSDLQLLDVAEMSVERGQPVSQGCCRVDPQIRIEAERGGAIQDLTGQVVEAARIEALGHRVLVEKLLQLAERAIALGAGERRCQVIHDHGTRPPLCLRAFARIVDDERVEMGQGAQHRLGPAAGRESQGLARQPFEIAVLAQMHDGMQPELMTQPEIEGQIAVRGHEIRRVVGALRVDVVAARRLKPDHQMAEWQDRQDEAPVLDVRVLIGLPPPLPDSSLQLRRQGP